MLSFSIQTAGHLLSIDIQLPTQGITAVFGPTGVGKSTFFKIIAGLKTLDNVEIKINKTVWQDQHYFMPIHQRQVALVKQRPYLFPHMSIVKNLQYPLKRRKSVLSLNELIVGFDLVSLLEKFPDMLSGGELQRVAIVQALLSNPKLLLLDEAFSAMDEKQKSNIISALQNHLSLHRCPVMMITHNIKEVALLAHRVLQLSSGKIETMLDKNDFLALYQETLIVGD